MQQSVTTRACLFAVTWTWGYSWFQIATSDLSAQSTGVYKPHLWCGLMLYQRCWHTRCWTRRQLPLHSSYHARRPFDLNLRCSWTELGPGLSCNDSKKGDDKDFYICSFLPFVTQANHKWEQCRASGGFTSEPLATVINFKHLNSQMCWFVV